MRGTFLVVLLAATLGCSGSSSWTAPQGSFRSDPADLVVGPTPDGSGALLDFTFRRVSSLSGLDDLPACPTTLPPELTASYADWQEALRAASTSWGLHLGASEATVVAAFTFPGGYACHSSGAGAVTYGAETITLADGSAGNYFWRKFHQTLGIRVHVAFPAQPPSSDLLSTGSDYDWLYGAWALQDGSGDRISLQKTPLRITEERVRQVGSPDRSDLPVPTLCHFQLGADAYQLLPVTGADPEIDYSATYVTQVDDARNSPGCALYVAEQQARISQGGLHVVWPIHRMPSGDLQVESSFVYARQ